MFHICASCGSWVERWETSVSESTIRCPECRGTHRFRFLPLLVLLGASGTGKTTVAWAFAGRRMPWVTLEQDILWRAELDEPEGGYRRYRETWLRLAANVHQSGYPVLLAGTGTPDQFEGCEERRRSRRRRSASSWTSARAGGRHRGPLPFDRGAAAARLDGDDGYERWSPDSSQIAYSENTVAGGFRTYVYDLATGETRFVTAGTIESWIDNDHILVT